MQREQREVRKKHRKLQQQFLGRLDAARSELDTDEARELVLAIEQERLAAELERYATAKRQALVGAVENWWDKYRISLRDLRAEQDASTRRLASFIEELGYAN